MILARFYSGSAPMAENVNEQTGELETVNLGGRFDAETLRNIGSFDDVADLFASVGAEVESTEDYGNGFELVQGENGKAALVGVPLVILGWTFAAGDYGTFVTMYILTKDGRKLIVNDGSTGIRQQLETITAQRTERGAKQPQMALKCLKGFSKADYTYVDSDGKRSPATTYRLAGVA